MNEEVEKISPVKPQEILALPASPFPIYHLKKLEVGRPTLYTPELADKICALLSEGISIRTICLSDDMPDKSTFFRWLRIHSELRDQYVRAKRESVDAMGEKILDLSDESVDLAIEVDPKASGAVVQAVKLQVDTRKWLMSKLLPKVYGDKIDVTSGGEIIKGNSINFNNFTLNESDSKSSI